MRAIKRSIGRSSAVCSAAFFRRSVIAEVTEYRFLYSSTASQETLSLSSHQPIFRIQQVVAEGPTIIAPRNLPAKNTTTI
jgi:hypothetical protein